MLIRSITQNAMDNKFSIRQFPSPEHPYIAFPQKNLAVLDISRFTTGEIGPQSRLLCNVKVRKATGPDNIPAWLLKNHAEVLAPPLTAIFNNSLGEGVVPIEWKTANVIPLPKRNPPVSIEKDIRPISLTPIAAKVFQSIVMKWIDEKWMVK